MVRIARGQFRCELNIRFHWKRPSIILLSFSAF
jgi:hypothetical protein